MTKCLVLYNEIGFSEISKANISCDSLELRR